MIVQLFDEIDTIIPKFFFVFDHSRVILIYSPVHRKTNFRRGFGFKTSSLYLISFPRVGRRRTAVRLQNWHKANWFYDVPFILTRLKIDFKLCYFYVRVNRRFVETSTWFDSFRYALCLIELLIDQQSTVAKQFRTRSSSRPLRNLSFTMTSICFSLKLGNVAFTILQSLWEYNHYQNIL